MKIAQIAPLVESVPPKLYGGTERVVSYLTEELVKQGHDVTLYASGDSTTKANLVAPCQKALRLDETCIDTLAHHIYMLELVSKNAGEFDVIHNHNDYFAYPTLRKIEAPHITTLHGRLDLVDLVNLYKEFNDVPVVSISKAQRDPLPNINWWGNVYHGIPENLYQFKSTQGKYLAFLGRICPEKRVDIAIQVAKKVKIPLKIAAKVDNVDRKYFETNIKPMLDDPLVEFIGEIGEEEKQDFLANAYALLFPIDWPEPFGMVMIESWACGTPVIARRRGSVPELMRNGKVGYACESVEEVVKAVEQVQTIKRQDCRTYFESHFTSERMAHEYVNLYHSLSQPSLLKKLAFEAA